MQKTRKKSVKNPRPEVTRSHPEADRQMDRQTDRQTTIKQYAP